MRHPRIGCTAEAGRLRAANAPVPVPCRMRAAHPRRLGVGCVPVSRRNWLRIPVISAWHS